jgi:hypothetical protein
MTIGIFTRSAFYEEIFHESRRMPSLLLSLIVTFGSIQTSPNGFRTTRWWPCWLKGMKPSVGGVKKGPNGTPAFDAAFARNACRSYLEPYRMILVHSIREIFVCSRRKTFGHLSDSAKKQVIDAILTLEHYTPNKVFVSPVGQHISWPDLASE